MGVIMIRKATINDCDGTLLVTLVYTKFLWKKFGDMI